MRDNCSSLTIALCLLLFPFSLLPFPLLVSRQKNRKKKKTDADRNLSYYIAECSKHETENRTDLSVYLFIHSLSLFLFFSAVIALRFVAATAGQTKILPPPPPAALFFFFFSEIFCCYFSVFC